MLSTQEFISLQFKTRQPNGLLFYSGKYFLYACVICFVSVANNFLPLPVNGKNNAPANESGAISSALSNLIESFAGDYENKFSIMCKHLYARSLFIK